VLVSINLAPGSASLAKGTSTSFTATGTYSDGTTANITTQATWTSVAPSTAAVGANTGIVVGVAEGTTTVFTALASITSPTVSVTVTPKVLTSIAVTPVSAAIAKDGYQSYTATGTYSDGSTGIITGSVAWHSSNTAVAIMNLSGGASGLSVGPVNISASLSGITSDSATLNIIAGFAGGASGLTTGHSIGLSNNGIDNLTLNGGPPYIPFSFATRLNHGAAYNLTITSVPAGMNCASLYGTGIVGTDNVTNMYVFCGLLYTGQWAATGINSTRVGHTATLLRDMMPNGKVLVAGGSAGSTSSYIFDPANPATPVIAAALTHTRTKHAATLLAVPFLSPPGLVLVSGGEGVAPGTYLASAELYNPTTDSWVDTGSLNLARSMHTSTLLNNGRVLVVGGLGGPIPVAIPVAEQYVIVTPTVGYWVPAGNLITARYGHTATLLPNGKVLVAGGNDTSGVALSSAELYDPATGQWSATGSLSTARFQHTATLLPDGRVLVVAGGAAAGLASAELYNPATGQWVATNSTHWPHQQHTATLLPSGNVLVVGGPIGYEANTELFNPASGTWTITSSLNTGRSAHTATLLPDGKVMVWGGSGTSGTGSTELYW
jgi:N-acetylneuraminic acid mutarotase